MALHDHFTSGGVFSPPPAGAALASGVGPQRVHYSFDFAQQVHYPHNSFQPGPIYFKTPRKCAVFGVCCEAIPRQVHYLIDEACDRGKGHDRVHDQLMLHTSVNGVVYKNIVAIDFSVFLEIIPQHLASFPPL